MLNVNQLLESVSNLSEAVNKAINLLVEYRDENSVLQQQVLELKTSLDVRNELIEKLETEIDELKNNPDESFIQAQSDIDTVTAEILNISVALNTALQ